MPLLSRGRGGVLVTPPPSGGQGGIVLGRPSATGSVPSDPLLSSLSEQGEAQLTGDITFSAGSGITLTQVGNDIEIALS